MADNYLITGYWGEPHVTAENDRGINAAMFGTGRFVLPIGEQFNAEYIGNNTIRMYDGKLMDNGAAAGIPVGEYIDLLIANAGQGMKRNDLIVFQYEQDSSTLVESGKFVVIQGTETSGTASDPELTQEDLLSGEAAFDQMALYRVSVSGTTIAAPVKLFSVYQNNGDHAADKNNPHGVTAEQVGAAESSHNHAASNITSGTLSSDRLPTVPITKGGLGATDRLGSAKNLTNEAVSSPNYVVGFTSSWGKFGYTSLAQLKSSLNMKILWTNASPTSTFAAQTITVDGLSDCSCIAILFNQSGAREFVCIQHKSVSGSLNTTVSSAYYASGAPYVTSRQVTTSFTNGKITFGAGYQQDYTSNDRAIPIAVIGLY